MKELEILIKIILEEYQIINDKWKNSSDYQPINMKKERVEDLYQNEELLLYVFKYRNFLNDNTSKLTNKLQDTNFKNKVTTRIKAINSIQSKVQVYELKDEQGKIPIKKCLNDIFGIRIIMKNKIDYNRISEYIKDNFSNTIKCINSSKDVYIAIHLYFGNENNNNFRWELQIWNKKDEKSNIISHFKHKQKYTKWEKKQERRNDI